WHARRRWQNKSGKPSWRVTLSARQSPRIFHLVARHQKGPAVIPSKDDLLAFITTQKGKIGTREIARAFGLKNADRATLKSMLRELADEGRIERRRRKIHHSGTLPEVVLADITERDSDGELIAIPAEWDSETHGEAPKIRIHVPRKARPFEIPGI